MNPAAALSLAAQYGLPTVLLFLIAYAYYRKDKACTEERAVLYKSLIDEQRARIDDAKSYHERMAKGQQDLVEIADKLSDSNDTKLLQRELLTTIGQVRNMFDQMERKELTNTGQHRAIDPNKPPGGRPR